MLGPYPARPQYLYRETADERLRRRGPQDERLDCLVESRSKIISHRHPSPLPHAEMLVIGKVFDRRQDIWDPRPLAQLRDRKSGDAAHRVTSVMSESPYSRLVGVTDHVIGCRAHTLSNTDLPK